MQAAIFDVDGTLVDSNDQHARAWEEAFRHFGHAKPYAEIRQHVGKGSDQLLPFFFSPEELREFGKALEDFRAELFGSKYRPTVKAFPQVRELLAKVKSAGLRIALATSAKAYEFEHNRKLLDAEDLVDHITTAEKVKRSKPYPDLFLTALEELSLPTEAAIVIGDSPWDAEAAAGAGLRCIGLLCGGFSETQLRESGCMQTFRDPAELLARFAESALVAPVA